ncbi:hypothetical protein C8F04DRAFT_1256033 [Mycena alexandri]|uniref:Uncharacterized protein n=1 Tax=Mycena alexandri TaxID=1745969 RepID=A0AAD6T2F3_9AGAR|nr:hypothetical protein C8F04DRAFT_1256033 [Mycena alexandri]
MTSANNKVASLLAAVMDIDSINLPTASTGELTTVPKKLTAEARAQQEAKGDLELANSYFERIGTRWCIHEFAIQMHSKALTRDSLARVVDTFENLYCAEMSTPPPLCAEDSGFDTKAAIPRGRKLALTIKAEHAWAYGFPERYTSVSVGVDISNDPVVPPAPKNTPDTNIAFSADEAKAALEHIQNLAQRLLPHHRCNYD